MVHSYKSMGLTKRAVKINLGYDPWDTGRVFGCETKLLYGGEPPHLLGLMITDSACTFVAKDGDYVVEVDRDGPVLWAVRKDIFERLFKIIG